MKSKIPMTNEYSNKKMCLRNNDNNNEYLDFSSGMVNFPTEYIQFLKESYPERSYLGKPEY